MENINDIDVAGFLELGKTVDQPETKTKGLIGRIWERRLVRGAAIGVATLALLSPLERDGFQYVSTRFGIDAGEAAFTTLNDKAQVAISKYEQSAPGKVHLAICNYAVEHHISPRVLESANFQCPITIPSSSPGEVHG